MENHKLASFIWSVADLLRGDFRQPEYGRIIAIYIIAASRVRVGAL